MNIRKAGYFILGIGILIIFFSLVVDYIGLGKAGIQAAQIFGIQAGMGIAIMGVIVAYHLPPGSIRTFFRKAGKRIYSVPTLPLIASGLVIAYIFLFLFPMFLNQEHSIQYFNRYLPEITPIGRDLTGANASIKGWLSGQSLYDNQNLYYPPFYAFMFAPFLLLSYPANYYLITFLTFISMIALFFLIPSLAKKMKLESSLLIFFFFTAIFSYGMQFEVERGQFNTIAFTMAILAIYIYHYHNSLRYYAYLLFSISIQIKIFPIVLILMFIKDWRDWKNNILRFFGLGIFNLAFLFSMGWQTLLDFTKALPVLLGAIWSRPYNHSIKSFIHGLANSEYGTLPPAAGSWIRENLSLVEYILLAYYFICLLTVLSKAYKNKEQSINFNLLLICTIGLMILPSSSVDYKLPLLAFPIAMIASARQEQLQGYKRILEIGLFIFISFAYSVTLFPFIYKPDFLANNFPLLLGILTAVTILNFLETRTPLSSIEIDSKTPLLN